MARLLRTGTTISGVIAAVLCVSCAAPGTSTSRDVTKANVTSGVQIGVGPCVTAQPPGTRALGATILAALVSKGVNLIGHALTEAGNDRTWRVMGARNLPGGSAPFPECVQVVRGRFNTDAPASSAPWLSHFASSDKAYDQLKKNGLWPADRPDFFFEGAIVTSEDKTAATVRPLVAFMNEPQGTRAMGGKERGVVLFFAFSTVGTQIDLETNPAATVVLGPMAPGRVLKFPAIGNVDKASTPYEASWFSLSETDARRPITVTSLLAETETGSPFFAFLASVFNEGNVKQAITDRANVIIVPGAREAAEEQEITERRTVEDNVDTKLASAIGKLVECHAAGANALEKGAEAKSALRAYLTADAALPTPQSKIEDKEIQLINLFNPDSVSASCNEVHERLTGKRL